MIILEAKYDDHEISIKMDDSIQADRFFDNLLILAEFIGYHPNCIEEVILNKAEEIGKQYDSIGMDEAQQM